MLETNVNNFSEENKSHADFKKTKGLISEKKSKITQ